MPRLALLEPATKTQPFNPRSGGMTPPTIEKLGEASDKENSVTIAAPSDPADVEVRPFGPVTKGPPQRWLAADFLRAGEEAFRCWCARIWVFSSWRC